MHKTMASTPKVYVGGVTQFGTFLICVWIRDAHPVLIWRLTCSQQMKGPSSPPGTHRGVVKAIAVRQPWLRGQAGAGKGAEQAGLELEGFTAAAPSRGRGVWRGTLSWAAAS
jgi:hypothetical protein